MALWLEDWSCDLFKPQTQTRRANYIEERFSFGVFFLESKLETWFVDPSNYSSPPTLHPATKSESKHNRTSVSGSAPRLSSVAQW